MFEKFPWKIPLGQCAFLSFILSSLEKELGGFLEMGMDSQELLNPKDLKVWLFVYTDKIKLKDHLPTLIIFLEGLVEGL